MNAEFKEDDDTKFNIDLDNELNTFELWNIDHWNVIHLSNEQVEELIKFLTKGLKK